MEGPISMKPEQAWMAETPWLVMMVITVMTIKIIMHFFIGSSWARIAQSV